jgi:hypothetical protein
MRAETMLGFSLPIQETSIVHGTWWVADTVNKAMEECLQKQTMSTT